MHDYTVFYIISNYIEVQIVVESLKEMVLLLMVK